MSSAQMATWFATLPTSPPAGFVKPWNNAGVLAFTPAEMSSDFLPITGGTLTGPLYGTSATFSGVLGGLVTATASTTPRLLADRFHDQINVLDFGAKLDGTTDDTAAWTAARAATAVNGTITVPRGQLSVTAAPTSGPTTPVLWKYDGLVFPGGSNQPVVSMGTDTVETFFASNKYFGRGSGYTNAGPVVRIDNTLNHAGGTASFTNNSLLVNTTASGTTGNFSYGITSQLSASRPSGGNSVALAGYATRTANGPAIFGGNIYAQDMTGNPSSVSGSAVGVELDVIANGDDDGGAGVASVPIGQGVRVIADITGAKAVAGGADAVIGWGVRVGPTSGTTTTSFKRMVACLGQFSIAAFSTEYAVEMSAAANAILLATGHHIGLDNAGPPSGTVPATAKLRLSSNGTNATLAGGGLILAPLVNAANDAAAASAGVAINQLYRNGSVVMQRVT
jgi:hypothetical protein